MGSRFLPRLGCFHREPAVGPRAPRQAGRDLGRREVVRQPRVRVGAPAAGFVGQHAGVEERGLLRLGDLAVPVVEHLDDPGHGGPQVHGGLRAQEADLEHVRGLLDGEFASQGGIDARR